MRGIGGYRKVSEAVKPLARPRALLWCRRVTWAALSTLHVAVRLPSLGLHSSPLHIEPFESLFGAPERRTSFAPAMGHRAGVRAAAPGCQCLGGSVLTADSILDAPYLITPYRFDCVIGTVDLHMCGED